jgi:hypothetical protein
VVASLALALLQLPLSASSDQKKEFKDFGLISGTVYGPDDRPAYGVKVKIHPVGMKHPDWERYSDHRGEFAQRVPLNHSDYEITAEGEIAPMVDGKLQPSHKKRVRTSVVVHVDKDVVRDVSLHLTEEATKQPKH